MAMLFFAGRAMLLASAVASTAAAEPDLEGLWRAPGEDRAQPAAIVRFSQVNGEYRGVIDSIPGAQANGAGLRCPSCTGSRRHQPLLNMEIVWGLKRQGLEYTSGSALDPETGEIYRCSLTIAANGRQLRIRYYAASQLESVSEVWIRDTPSRATRPHRLGQARVASRR